MTDTVMAKMAVMETNKSKLIVVLHGVQTNPNTNVWTYTFSYIDFFMAQSRIILEANHDEQTYQWCFDPTYDEEKADEVVVLPQHADEMEIISFLQLLHLGQIPSLEIDFFDIDTSLSYTFELEKRTQNNS